MNDWNSEEFSPEEIRKNYSDKVFTVPRYQRGIVWSAKQKAELIDSIKKGLPFGTLLLYKDSKTNIYQVIDGLQRSNTVLEFVNNPAQFFDEADMDIGVIRKIVDLIGVKGNVGKLEEDIQKLLLEWVKKGHPTLKDVENMQYHKFGKVVAEKYATCKGREIEIAELVEPMMQNYKAICRKISQTRIPAIVMTGDDEMLPELFERINSRGTQLTKYQIYAASWSNTSFKITSDELTDLIKYNKERYDNMLEGNSFLDDYEPSVFMKKCQLDAFQIAYGFGKYLCHKWPHLFGKPRSNHEVESIGFNLLTACLGLKNKDGKFLHTKLVERIGEAQINEFLLKIIEAVNITDKAIGKFSKFKLNSRKNSGLSPLHSEYQIVSIITSVFLCKYATIELDKDDEVICIEFDFEKQNVKWKRELKKQFENNVAKIYILEILGSKWVGGADRKMDHVLITPECYTKTILKDEFIKGLDEWYDKLNESRQEYQRVKSPQDEEILVLATLYLNLFSANQQVDGSKYDIEHIATQKLMKLRLEKYNGEIRLPISSIGNLCLLPEYPNRSKGEKTIYQDSNYLTKSNITIKEVEQKYSFTTENDLEWLEDTNLMPDEFEDAYRKFINKRFERIKEKIIQYFFAI